MRFPQRIQTWLVLAAMAAFVVWFGAYAVRLHAAHLTAKSDLGQIDLAIWNTAHGRFLQEIKDETLSTRLTDHVELIFLPVSLVFRVWDDVRALLWLQAAALALAAWPIYRLSQRWLGRALAPPSGVFVAGGRAADWPAWGGLVFVLAYLLSPALQVAALSEFHALPLAPPLIAWAFWSVEQRHWGRFALAAFLLAHVQEGMALLTALLGVYAAFRAWRAQRPGAVEWRTGVLVGLGTLAFGLAWFGLATFVIIPSYAQQAYGLSQTPYVSRYGALGDSFGDVLVALVTRPGLVLGIASEPLRVRYVAGLFAPVALLALLAPEILLLAAPLFLANLLSSFPLQYAGGLHYSAPLVPYVVIAGALGLSRLVRIVLRLQRRSPGTDQDSGHGVLAAGLALVLLSALAWQVWAGYTPIGREFRRLVPDGWPGVTAHHRLLDRFAAQIPVDAPLSVATDLYPHLSHRELIYRFPALGQAEWVLVDVTGTTDMHPVAVRDRLMALLASGWGVVDAADGYLLLGKGQGAAALPDAFYDFARAPRSQGDQPQYPLDVTFDGRLRLIGYDLVNHAKWRRTQARLYFQALEPLPEDTAITVQALTPDGVVVDDTALRPPPVLVWRPPATWEPGETVAVTLLSWYLPVEWAHTISVESGGMRWSPSVGSAPPMESGPVVAPDGRLRLPPWARRDERMIPLDAPKPERMRPVGARFAGADWAVTLDGAVFPEKIVAGEALPVRLRWRADAPALHDYSVFLHLRRDGADNAVAQGDAAPVWFTPIPATRWPGDGRDVWTAQSVSLPSDLPPGDYTLMAGWYDPASGARLPLEATAGNAGDDAFVLGSVQVQPGGEAPADLCCAAVPVCCASME